MKWKMSSWYQVDVEISGIRKRGDVVSFVSAFVLLLGTQMVEFIDRKKDNSYFMTYYFGPDFAH